MLDRYTDRLFGEILVPLTGVEASWLALEQAILVAKKEGSVLHGLHVIPAGSSREEDESIGIQARFNQRCVEANINGNLVAEVGNVSKKVTNRALLTDLIALHVAHPPSPGISSLQSGLRTIIRNSARPILTVPEKVSPMDCALLAFDGSITSREALFVATYLAEKWKSKLVVLTVRSDDQKKVQEYARSYLELHGIQADYIAQSGSRDIILKTIQDFQINLVVMGSYSGTTLKEVVVGSAVNFLLRDAKCSLLICR
jgi:nucleotide-binding universal stress UspA family protein